MKSGKSYNSSAQWYAIRKATLRHLPGETLAALQRVAIRTQAETAEILGVSPQNIQQIERRALWKIREAMSKEWREHKEAA